MTRCRGARRLIVSRLAVLTGRAAGCRRDGAVLAGRACLAFCGAVNTVRTCATIMPPQASIQPLTECKACQAHLVPKGAQASYMGDPVCRRCSSAECR